MDNKKSKLVCKECGFTADLDDVLGNELRRDAQKIMVVKIFEEGTVHRCPECDSPMDLID